MAAGAAEYVIKLTKLNNFLDLRLAQQRHLDQDLGQRGADTLGPVLPLTHTRQAYLLCGHQTLTDG
jgi:hypothetical protein